MSQYQVKSLKKTLDILMCFSASKPERTVSELSAMLGLEKASVRKILSALEQERLVEKDTTTRAYRLGTAILHLGNVVREGSKIRRVALPIMEEVREHFQETVHLAIEEDGYVVYLESIQPSDRAVSRLATGMRARLHCTGVGKAILAFAAPERVAWYINERGLKGYTPNTIVTAESLRSELQRIRRNGYAVDDMEHEWGCRCIAVPIREPDGAVCASMSISGPAQRYPLARIEGMARTLMPYGLEISRRLGL